MDGLAVGISNSSSQQQLNQYTTTQKHAMISFVPVPFLLLLLLLLLLLFLLCFGCHKNERNQTVKVGLLNRQHTESAAYIKLDLKTKRETNKRHRE